MEQGKEMGSTTSSSPAAAHAAVSYPMRRPASWFSSSPPPQSLHASSLADATACGAWGLLGSSNRTPVRSVPQQLVIHAPSVRSAVARMHYWGLGFHPGSCPGCCNVSGVWQFTLIQKYRFYSYLEGL
ncbi:unnamed protein product [Urochloa humidicola]